MRALFNWSIASETSGVPVGARARMAGMDDRVYGTVEDITGGYYLKGGIAPRCHIASVIGRCWSALYGVKSRRDRRPASSSSA